MNAYDELAGYRFGAGRDYDKRSVETFRARALNLVDELLNQITVLRDEVESLRSNPSGRPGVVTPRPLDTAAPEDSWLTALAASTDFPPPPETSALSDGRRYEIAQPPPDPRFVPVTGASLTGWLQDIEEPSTPAGAAGDTAWAPVPVADEWTAEPAPEETSPGLGGWGDDIGEQAPGTNWDDVALAAVDASDAITPGDGKPSDDHVDRSEDLEAVGTAAPDASRAIDASVEFVDHGADGAVEATWGLDADRLLEHPPADDVPTPAPAVADVHDAAVDAPTPAIPVAEVPGPSAGPGDRLADVAPAFRERDPEDDDAASDEHRAGFLLDVRSLESLDIDLLTEQDLPPLPDDDTVTWAVLQAPPVAAPTTPTVAAVPPPPPPAAAPPPPPPAASPPPPPAAPAPVPVSVPALAGLAAPALAYARGNDAAWPIVIETATPDTGSLPVPVRHWSGWLKD